MKKFSLLSVALLASSSLAYILHAEDAQKCPMEKGASSDAQSACSGEKSKCSKSMDSLTEEEKAECKKKCEAWAKKTDAEKAACQKKCEAKKAESTEE